MPPGKAGHYFQLWQLGKLHKFQLYFIAGMRRRYKCANTSAALTESESESSEVEAQVTKETNNVRPARASSGQTKKMSDETSDGEETEILAVTKEDEQAEEDEEDEDDEEAEEDVYVANFRSWNNAPNSAIDSLSKILKPTCLTRTSVYLCRNCLGMD
jgi:thymidylate synthase